MQEVLFHITLFLGASAAIYLCGGVLVDATATLARQLHRTRFIIAFLLLGVVTSLSEASVAIHSALGRVPEVSAGNLVGASLVIFLFLIPLFAILGNGIALQSTFDRKQLLFALLVIASPAFFVFDGELNRVDGAFLVLLYALLVHQLRVTASLSISQVGSFFSGKGKKWRIIGQVILAAGVIFIGGRIFVREAVFFSTLLAVPASLIGILVVAIGTNVPELVIGVRAIRQRRKTVAFGDYIGSAAFNTCILGILTTVYGPFGVDRSEFFAVALFLIGGLLAFYWFARSRQAISRLEGVVLFFVYAVFVVWQIIVTI